MFVVVSPYYMDRFLNLRYLKLRGFSPFLILLSTVVILGSADYISSVYKVYLLDQELLGMESDISELEQSNNSEEAVKAKEAICNKAKDFNVGGTITQVAKSSPK